MPKPTGGHGSQSYRAEMVGLYAGLHAFNRTSEDGKKVFSQWSNVKKVNVK